VEVRSSVQQRCIAVQNDSLDLDSSDLCSVPCATLHCLCACMLVTLYILMYIAGCYRCLTRRGLGNTAWVTASMLVCASLILVTTLVAALSPMCNWLVSNRYLQATLRVLR
jgi:hypothetical protein